MIYFKTVRYKNLLSSGNNFAEVSLCENSVIIITGTNGSGKSTILDAICFGMFGKAFRNVNKGNLVNSINGGDLVVEIEFSIGNREYKIVRGIKPNIFEIYVDGNLLDQVSNVKDQQTYLERNILRKNFKSFTQVDILGSASHTPFMQLKASDRREVIEELLDLTVFSTMKTLLKDKIDVLKDQINQIGYDISTFETKIELEEEYIQKIETSGSVRTEKIQKDIEFTNNEIEERRRTIQELDNTIAPSSVIECEQKNKTLDKKIRELEKFEYQIETKIKNLKKDLSFFTDNDECPTCSQSISQELKDSKIKLTNDKISESEDGTSKLQIAMQKLQSEKDSIQDRLSSIDDTRRKITAHKAHIESLEKYINKIRKDLEENDHETSLVDRNTALEKLKKELKDKQDEKETFLNKKEIQTIAATLLKDNGIKASIIKQYMPIINASVSKYLSQMDFFVKFTLDENFEESIHSRHLDDFKYYNFSEGEKQRLDMALLLTWRDVAKKKNSMATNLLLMDEIFDSALDSEGTESFVKLIKSFKDQNVIIITHNHSVVDKFESSDSAKHLRFEKVKNFSKLS